LLIAAFVCIPIVNLATPLFATALMVHVHKRMTEDERRTAENRLRVR
jgi:CysZ protein